MYEKAGKYYADWRDADGKRLRKSFTNRRAALTFEAEQKELAHPKHSARGTHSPKFCASNSSDPSGRRATSTKSPKASSLRLVKSRRRNSAPRT